MELGQILGYIGTAVGAGGITQLVNWRWSKRKTAASVKADEIETMRKAMEDFYKPLVEQQNNRIHQLEGEVESLRKQLSAERDEHRRQIEALQRQIVEITKALGIRANNKVRDERTGRYAKKEEEGQ